MYANMVPSPKVSTRRRLMVAAGALLGVVVCGTVGFSLIEGWALADSLFFVVITLTTVGYNDYEISQAGKVFAIGMMAVGLVVTTFSAGQLLPLLFNQKLIWERKMNNRIRKLKDHFIVCGVGRIGLAVCRHLAREGVPFIAIDPDPEQVAMLIEADHLGLVGDATSDEVLEEAGIVRAKAIACVSGSDSENIVIALTARAQNPELMIVGRAEHEESITKMERAGATRVICPIRSGSASIVNAILKPNLAEFLDVTHDRAEDFELAEITIEDASVLDGSTVAQKLNRHDGVAVIALKRPGTPTRLRPKSNAKLRSGDTLIVAGQALALHALQQEAAASGRRAA